jgi:glycerol-3-phosphate dehydrogenase
VLGTTDTPIDDVTLEPHARDEEVAFLLESAAAYMTRDPTRADVLSVFVGIRPLVKTSDESTAALSRDHAINISGSGLLTIAGGKWTTYRRMAEDCVNQATTLAGIELRPCVTKELRIHGSCEDVTALTQLWVYGTDAEPLLRLVADNPDLGRVIDARLPIIQAQVVWAARHEMARTVDDVLSRRTRALLFDARAAIDAAPLVARLLADELGHADDWVSAQISAFRKMAQSYVLSPETPTDAV